jgi:hypothetical protein
MEIKELIEKYYDNNLTKEEYKKKSIRYLCGMCRWIAI